MQGDFVFDTGGLPLLACQRGEAGIDVAGGDATVFRQRECHCGAAVAGEYTDFEIAFRFNQAGEPSQRGGLLGRNRHFAQAVAGGFAAQAGEHGMFRLANLAQIGRQLGRKGGSGNAHCCLVGLVSVRLFRQLGGGEVGFVFRVEFNIPQQAAVFQAAFGFFGMLFQIIVKELGGFGLVVVHGVIL